MESQPFQLDRADVRSRKRQKGPFLFFLITKFSRCAVLCCGVMLHYTGKKEKEEKRAYLKVPKCPLKSSHQVQLKCLALSNFISHQSVLVGVCVLLITQITHFQM